MHMTKKIKTSNHEIPADSVAVNEGPGKEISDTKVPVEEDLQADSSSEDVVSEDIRPESDSPADTTRRPKIKTQRVTEDKEVDVSDAPCASESSNPPMTPKDSHVGTMQSVILTPAEEEQIAISELYRYIARDGPQLPLPVKKTELTYEYVRYGPDDTQADDHLIWDSSKCGSFLQHLQLASHNGLIHEEDLMDIARPLLTTDGPRQEYTTPRVNDVEGFTDITM